MSFGALWVFRGLRDGVLTTRWPARRDAYADEWRGPATVLAEGHVAAGELDTLCPAGAIGRRPDGGVSLDQGRCIGCGRCVAARPDAFGWERGPASAALTRGGLVVPEGTETDQVLAAVRDSLRRRTRAFGRSVHIRHVDAGSDGSEEWEVHALLNPVYDVHRLGIFFTASPRHADVLLVTGSGARGMAEPLRRTYQGMPDPKIVIAAGTDAVSGGLLDGSYATRGGVAEIVPVDVWVPGSPPSPFNLLYGLLLGAAGLTGLGRSAAGPTPPARLDEPLAAPSRAQRFAPAESARWVLAALPYLLGCAGSACLAVAGGAAVAGHGSVLDHGDQLGFAGVWFAGLAHTVLAGDRLSGLFLLIAFGAAVPVSLGFAGWPPDRGGPAAGQRGYRGLGALNALTLGAIAVIMTARDAFVLLFGWELLTVAFYLLAGFERRKPGRPGEALVTLVFGKISGASLLAGLLLLASRSGSMALASFAHVPGGAARSTGYVLLVTGFAVKAGLLPFQVWLPRGYSAAPGPARAVMAGVGSTVGFYGLWRTLDLLGAPPGWLAGVLLTAAAVTAVLGIAHAAVATQLPRVIAYSSVENTGLIVAGFGVALTGAATHDSQLVAAGLLAATLQVITHTVAKSVLMLTGARIESAMGTGDLDRLRGAGRRVPWSGTGLAVAALTLAGLPLTAGFVSEWFLLESLMQQFRVPGLGFRLVLAVTGAAVALTVGFAGVTFVRMVGLIAAGPPQERARTGPDFGWAGRTGVLTLAACCLGLAMVTPLEIRVIVRGLAPLVPAGVSAGAL
ncbi:MAG: hypothetical protein LBV78_15170, partial [Kitasatospora sp.]|nr:hypothetical protein [Kitasatospora sp.]